MCNLMCVCGILGEAMVPSCLKYQNWSSIGTPGIRMSGCCWAMSGQWAFSPETMMSAALQASSIVPKCSGFSLWHSNISILYARNTSHTYYRKADAAIM